MRKTMKYLAVFLSFVFILSSFPARSLEAASKSGTCGNNVKWSISGDTLTISGSGKMAFKSMMKQPWAKYKKDIKTVVFKGKVESIERYAFSDCKNLTTVSIPSSVKEIGANAFSRCSSLDNLTISKGVKWINDYAFMECTSLTDVTIPDSVARINDGAFYGCTKLENVKLSSRLGSLRGSIFANCVSLQSISIPKNVKAIFAEAFMNCKSLKSVYIPKNVTYIGLYPFSGCVNLKKVTGGANLKVINKHAFQGCKKLSFFSVTSKQLYKIGADAFAYCPKLYTINIKNTTALKTLRVRNSLRKSSVNTVRVKKSKVNKYKKLFKKSNSGRKVQVKQ